MPLRDAAELVGLSQKALARRAERGSLRVVLRNGKRHVPRSELVRAGLLDPEGNPVPTTVGHPTTVGNPEGLSRLIERLETLAAENAQLRLLEQQAGAEREARERAEAHAHELRLWKQQVTTAGWRERRRLLKDAS